MRHAAWILGYHGCDRKVGERLLSGKDEIKPSQNPYDWLGTGAYFWENSYPRALAWAESSNRNQSAKNKRAKPFVVGAIIDPGNCLDLSEAGCLDILRTAYPAFEGTMKAMKASLPINRPAHPSDQDLVQRKLDCAVINFLHQLRENTKEPAFDTVRCPFMEGGPLFAGSKFSARTHVQLCVRHPHKSIIAYFRPRLALAD